MIQVQLISPAIATTQSCKVHKIGNLQANIKGYSKNFYFPAEKLTKNTRALLFSFDSVSKIFANLLNFPAKRLRKNTAPKIRMRQFFKNLVTKLAVFSIQLWFYILFFNEIKYSFLCVIYYGLTFLLNKPLAYILQLQIVFIPFKSFGSLKKVSRKIFRIYTKTFGGKTWKNLHSGFPGKFSTKKFNKVLCKVSRQKIFVHHL